MKRFLSVVFALFCLLPLLGAGGGISAEPAWRESIARDNVRLWNEEIAPFPDARVYYALIPDKEYYTNVENESFYSVLLDLTRENAPEGTKEVALSPLLSVSDYYPDDRHWRQENLYPVAARIAGAMGTVIEDPAVFREERWEDMAYLCSPVLDACSVLFYTMGENGISTEAGDLYRKTPGAGYSLFLSGAQALVRIDNPLCENGRTLILFRDSFASSLAPLLVGGCSRIWLVDTRYLSHRLLAEIPEFIEESAPDILFLYSAAALSGTVMR